MQRLQRRLAYTVNNLLPKSTFFLKKCTSKNCYVNREKNLCGDVSSNFDSPKPLSQLIFLICITMYFNVDVRQILPETAKLPEIAPHPRSSTSWKGLYDKSEKFPGSWKVTWKLFYLEDREQGSKTEKKREGKGNWGCGVVNKNQSEMAEDIPWLGTKDSRTCLCNEFAFRCSKYVLLQYWFYLFIYYDMIGDNILHGLQSKFEKW